MILRKKHNNTGEVERIQNVYKLPRRIRAAVRSYFANVFNAEKPDHQDMLLYIPMNWQKKQHWGKRIGRKSKEMNGAESWKHMKNKANGIRTRLNVKGFCLRFFFPFIPRRVPRIPPLIGWLPTNPIKPACLLTLRQNAYAKYPPVASNCPKRHQIRYIFSRHSIMALSVCNGFAAGCHHSYPVTIVHGSEADMIAAIFWANYVSQIFQSQRSRKKTVTRIIDFSMTAVHADVCFCIFAESAKRENFMNQ